MAVSAPRRFDHDECAALYQTGEWTQAALAAKYDVTEGAIYQALAVRDPEWRKKRNDRSRKWQRGRYRRPCLRGCGRTAWHGAHGTGVCHRCTMAEKATTVAADRLLCTTCGEWKPDDAFPSQKSAVARRGRHGICRGCQTAVRQAYRERHKVPCERCGQPCLPPSEKAGRRVDRAVCRSCYRQTELPAARVKATAASTAAARRRRAA